MRLRSALPAALLHLTAAAPLVLRFAAEALERLAENGGANLDVELCGVCTDICVVSNALLIKAHLPEAFVHVDAACCAGVSASVVLSSASSSSSFSASRMAKVAVSVPV